MNNHRHQHHPNNHARNWSQHSSQQYARPYQGLSKSCLLESELRALENQLVELEEQIDAAYEKGRDLALARERHESGKALAIGVALVSAFGVRLPPVAQEWQYRKGKLDDQMLRLKYHCTDLAARRRALDIKITRTRDAIADLQFEP